MHVLRPQESDTGFLTLLRRRDFLRFFLAQAVSSLGDWIGVIAIAVFAEQLGGTTAVGAVMTARVLPGFVIGPLGGVLADRWDRKRTMVVADVLRAVVIMSLPFVPNLLYLLLASAVLESLTLVWGPAKDASLPHFVEHRQLPQASSLSLIAIYGPWPVASILFASLTTVGVFLSENAPVMAGLENRPEALALWVDSLTFAFSAIMVSTLAIPTSRRRGEKFDLREVRRDLLEGLKFVRDHRQVRPWLLGIAFTFTAAGGVFSLGVGFVDEILGAGERGFAFVIGFLGVGMIAGLLASGALAKRIHKDVLFTSSLFLLGMGLIVLASMGSLDAAIPVASALGFFGGVAYATAYSLIQETTHDELRGRTFSAGYTLIRIGTLVGLGLFPLIAGAIGDHTLRFGDHVWPLPGTRLTLWIAGLVVVGGGGLSMRAIRERGALGAPAAGRSGLLVVFEGGEGAGKTTQIERAAQWLRSKGIEVVVTREPGGTVIGRRIRTILLDPDSVDLAARAEALLYAADRAQHVHEVIAPALAEGRVVLSDRYVDSSLAYQGAARDLGVDEILRISNWATGDLLPHVVVYLDVDPAVGLGRSGDTRDRMEQQAETFHARVRRAYLDLAKRWPGRFVVVDATRSADVVHAEVVDLLEVRLGKTVVPFPQATTPSPMQGPLPR